jgi:hypothetical protein
MLCNLHYCLRNISIHPDSLGLESLAEIDGISPLTHATSTIPVPDGLI